MVTKILCLVILSVIYHTNALKILFTPFPQRNHYLELRSVALELKARGHHITFFTGTFAEKDIKMNNFSYIGYKTSESAPSEHVSRHRLVNSDYWSPLTKKALASICDAMLAPENMVALKSQSYDVTLLDTVPVMYCSFAIAQHVGAPVVASVVLPPYFFARIPALPLIPFHEPIFDVALEPTFTGRLINLVTTVFYELYLLPTFINLESYKKIMDCKSVPELTEKTIAWQVQHNLILEHIYPSPPNVAHIGGHAVKAPGELPQEFKTIVDSAKSGVIVMTLGSGFSYLTSEMVQKLSNAFETLPQTVIVRLEGAETKLMTTRVIVRSWLPQNELLAHPNVKLFITHSGNNGQLEALYHGVPMLCFHVCCDQHSNAVRVTRKGFGLQIDLHSFTSLELSGKIKEILSNNTYTTNIKLASQIFRRQPSKISQAADMVEQVARDEYRWYYPTESQKLNFLQFYNIDVILALIAIVIVLLYMFTRTFIRCFK